MAEVMFWDCGCSVTRNLVVSDRSLEPGHSEIRSETSRREETGTGTSQTQPSSQPQGHEACTLLSNCHLIIPKQLWQCRTGKKNCPAELCLNSCYGIGRYNKIVVVFKSLSFGIIMQRGETNTQFNSPDSKLDANRLGVMGFYCTDNCQRMPACERNRIVHKIT